MQEKKQGGRITAGAEMSTNTSKFPYTLLKAVQGHYAHLSCSASKAIRIARSRWVLLTQLLPFRSHTPPTSFDNTISNKDKAGKDRQRDRPNTWLKPRPLPTGREGCCKFFLISFLAYFLEDHKVVLCSCAFVDLFLIPGGWGTVMS